jgi:hypothetical protein
MNERFSLDINIDEYYEMLELSKRGHVIYKLNGSTSIREIEYKNIKIWVIFGNAMTGITTRLKTALIPHKFYLVPTVLDHIYDHETFTVKLNETIKEIKELSKSYSINDKKTLFTDPNLTKLIKNGILNVLIGNENAIINIAIKHMIENEVEQGKHIEIN